MHRPDGRVARIPWAAMAEQGGDVWQVLGFEKEFAKGRMREVVGREREDDFDVAGHVDFADTRALVDHRHAADFHVVFGGHRNVELRGDLVVMPAERRTFRAELNHVVVRLCRRRMVRG